MIYNKKNILINRIIHYYVKWIVARQFHEVLFNNIEVDKNKSVLLIANHFSFWDGLILYCVTQKLLKKQYHVMVEEKTVHMLHYLKFAGAFSINKKSRDIIESLDYAARLLDDPQNLVLIFPQGKLFSNYVEDVRFDKGVFRIMKKAYGKYQLVFASTFIQYFKHKKSTATVYLKSDNNNYTGITALKEAYQQHYSSSKLLQTEFDI
ncbi:1-acyl-sn-glycerol-3-phosphate acyltransferase [Mucilaginibacter sp. KACC 22773]|uniref:1-acyl-sn-glycerol-3-phosphate acyltransferase n=1 Tax=Mucilaginibacter sp. KACC 22773 TaxID=3025671 RepID=UPI002365F8D8|nr:1-acyl-sn-glycerol-3-phosphate acyltransferase [Mucilaginibacter sp. KACC 22773]WDF77393.1 1-acyl-sn-glycerol-3-phosphate acyltransferase [Mucilaginibacter sp. KACC 22773]